MKALYVVSAAREWIGTPFHHQGRARGAGVDCIGLVVGVGRELGIWPREVDRLDYGPLPLNGLLLAGVREHCAEIQIAEATPGCILLMRWHRETQHVAVLTGETIIHACVRRGKVVEQGFRGHWPRRTQHAFRLPGVSYV